MSAHESNYNPTNPVEKWLDSRLPLIRFAKSTMIDFPTPKNLNYWWTFGAILAGIMIAITFVGGEMAQINIKLPFAAVGIFQAMMLFLILASDILVRYRIRLVRSGEVTT